MPLECCKGGGVLRKFCGHTQFYIIGASLSDPYLDDVNGSRVRLSIRPPVCACAKSRDLYFVGV